MIEASKLLKFSFGTSLNRLANMEVLKAKDPSELALAIKSIPCQVEVVSINNDTENWYAFINTDKKLIQKKDKK